MKNLPFFSYSLIPSAAKTESTTAYSSLAEEVCVRTPHIEPSYGKDRVCAAVEKPNLVTRLPLGYCTIVRIADGEEDVVQTKISRRHVFDLKGLRFPLHLFHTRDISAHNATMQWQNYHTAVGSNRLGKPYPPARRQTAEPSR